MRQLTTLDAQFLAVESARTLGIVADRELVADAWSLPEGLEHALEELEAAIAAPA